MFLLWLNVILIIVVVILLGFLFFMKRYMAKNGFVVKDRKGNPIETTGTVVSEEEPKAEEAEKEYQEETEKQE